MPTEIDLGPKARAFRDDLRQWLEANRSDDVSEADEPSAFTGRTAAAERWTDKLGEAGYLCVAWPKEFGGRGLSGVEVAVMNEEFSRARLPRVTRGMGENLVGPSIIVHGTDEQKAYFLPRIISGEDVYCQGFSEPDAGSDLAGLKTRGVVDGDEVIVTGQKVWTSGAQAANMIFTLCRTDPDVPKHQGISYVLVPMGREDGSSNGIELRNIKQITGTAHFCETFMTEARAPMFNVIGGLNNGWRVAMTTLGNERGGSATTQHLAHQRTFWAATKEARQLGRASDPVLRQEFARAYCEVEIMRYSGLRLLSDIVNKKEPGPQSSLNKMFWSEHQRRFAEVIMNFRGMQSTVRPDGEGYRLDRWQMNFLSSRSHTIWGGTAEVQRNIAGEKVLGLPKDPGIDAGVPK